MYLPSTFIVAKQHLSKFNYYFIVLNLFWMALYFHCYVMQSLTKQTIKHMGGIYFPCRLQDLPEFKYQPDPILL